MRALAVRRPSVIRSNRKRGASAQEEVSERLL